MKISQIAYQFQSWSSIRKDDGFSAEKAQLVLAFGERNLFETVAVYSYLRTQFPHAHIVINSTSGEIFNDMVYDDTIIATAIEFSSTQVKVVKKEIQDHTQSFEMGKSIAHELIAEGLNNILLISDGGRVNGSELVRAFNEETAYKIPVTGGLAGDQARFEKTLVGLNAEPTEGQIVGIGFYGKALKIGHGTMGGWDVFGPEREITGAQYNVLYSIGDKPALDLYKEYLGKYASELPGAALLFPLSLRDEASDETVVRTILSINEAEKSMTFAGEMPKGAYIRFMKANFDHIIDASASAAEDALTNVQNEPDLAILISCVGRKLVLGTRIDEEVEAAREIFGEKTAITGFYSYGEISPLQAEVKCQLHNQTMTITTFIED